MELYLCRHGETEWSLSGQHTSVTDIGLTKKGEGESLRLRKRLQKESFDKVLTSPRKRATETCEGMGAIVEPLAVEWNYGDYEGLTKEQIHRKKPGWNLFTDGAPNGESPEQVGKRADLLLKKMGRGKVAIFSHAHFLRVLAARFLGLDPQMGELFSLSTGSLSILGYEGTPIILLWNQTF